MVRKATRTFAMIQAQFEALDRKEGILKTYYQPLNNKVRCFYAQLSACASLKAGKEQGQGRCCMAWARSVHACTAG